MHRLGIPELKRSTIIRHHLRVFPLGSAIEQLEGICKIKKFIFFWGQTEKLHIYFMKANKLQPKGVGSTN